MFAMLNGRLPRATIDGVDLVALETESAAGHIATADLDAAVDRVVGDVVRAQEAAGLDLVTDGQVRWPDPGAAVLRALADGHTGDDGLIAGAWRATAGLTERPVAQVVPGPYSLGRRVEGELDAAARSEFTHELADRLGRELAALAAAGCPLVVVEEPAAVEIGGDAGERALFLAAQQRLLAPTPDLHAMLAICGGSAREAGSDTILGAPYRSFLFDLIAGPDNWYLVRAAPGDRGIVCAVLVGTSRADQAPELVWAAGYAASGNGRGPARVGLSNAGSLHDLAPEAAHGALAALGRAARLAALPPEEAIAQGLDRRTFAQPPGRGAGRHRGARRRGASR